MSSLPQSTMAEWEVTRSERNGGRTGRKVSEKKKDERKEGGRTVPENDASRLPLSTSREVVASEEVLVQKTEDRLTLLLLEADDAAREARVDVERLVAGNGVTTDEGVDVLDRLTLDGVSALGGDGTGGLLEAGVLDFEGLEVGGERGGETVVGLCRRGNGIESSEPVSRVSTEKNGERRTSRRDEKGVSARLRCVVEEEGGETGRLELVGHVAVEGTLVQATIVGALVGSGGIVTVDEVELRVLGRLSRDGVNVDAAKRLSPVATGRGQAVSKGEREERRKRRRRRTRSATEGRRR